MVQYSKSMCEYQSTAVQPSYFNRKLLKIYKSLVGSVLKRGWDNIFHFLANLFDPET